MSETDDEKKTNNRMLQKAANRIVKHKFGNGAFNHQLKNCRCTWQFEPIRVHHSDGSNENNNVFCNGGQSQTWTDQGVLERLRFPGKDVTIFSIVS